MAKLTAKTVEAAKAPGYYGDGGNLYLQVKAGGARSWIFRFQIEDRRRDMGLGPLDTVTLVEARDRAHAARKLVRDGKDPIEARRAVDVAQRLEQARAMTFKAAAEAYIDANKSGWKNAKHGAQWKSTLATYAYPVFGALPVGEIDVALVTKVLQPIWAKKTETAARVRGRIENILDWAKVNGYRTGENPARWQGHLENILPERSKVQKVKHHAALPYSEMSAFVARVRELEGVSARALEFAILTAGRTGEVLGARWDEIDLGKKLWTIPAERMKSAREHKVPLSAAAVDALMALEKSGPFIFRGGNRGKPLSNMALLMLLRRMGRDDLTAHGFRSTFRDWAAERTNFPSEVAEMALAHVVGDKVEAAYRRGDLFEKRRAMAEAWAKFCSAKPADAKIVVHIGHAKATK